MKNKDARDIYLALRTIGFPQKESKYYTINSFSKTGINLKKISMFYIIHDFYLNKINKEQAQKKITKKFRESEIVGKMFEIGISQKNIQSYINTYYDFLGRLEGHHKRLKNTVDEIYDEGNLKGKYACEKIEISMNKKSLLATLFSVI